LTALIAKPRWCDIGSPPDNFPIVRAHTGKAVRRTYSAWRLCCELVMTTLFTALCSNKTCVVPKGRTGTMSSATNRKRPSRQGDNAMSSRIELIPADVASVNPGGWKQRLFTAIFLIISAIAMIAWLTALGWAAIEFSEWLFF
jgi:hypothetical protein